MGEGVPGEDEWRGRGLQGGWPGVGVLREGRGWGLKSEPRPERGG